MKRIAAMINPVQEYAWGSRSFLPELLGESVPSERPQAELWMGAHPKAPSLIPWRKGPRSLQALIQEYPLEILGGFAAAKFSNTLPFLFKVLAVERPLSIQAHPNREQARAGLDRENTMNIPINDPRRNYRDGNPKPELLCALSPFSALKGFRKVSEILALTGMMPSLKKMAEAVGTKGEDQGLKEFFGALMTAERKVQERIISEAVAFSESNPHSDPAYQWVRRLHREFPGDAGALSPLFLKSVELGPGEAVFVRRLFFGKPPIPLSHDDRLDADTRSPHHGRRVPAGSSAIRDAGEARIVEILLESADLFRKSPEDELVEGDSLL